jgi:hypothetical protein
VVRPLKDVAPPAMPAPQAEDRPFDFEGGGESPARQLQQELERALVGLPEEAKWSPRRSLALIVTTNGLFWLAFIFGLRAIL